jgi:hypothetical protein
MAITKIVGREMARRKIALISIRPISIVRRKAEQLPRVLGSQRARRCIAPSRMDLLSIVRRRIAQPPIPPLHRQLDQQPRAAQADQDDPAGVDAHAAAQAAPVDVPMDAVLHVQAEGAAHRAEVPISRKNGAWLPQ